MIEKSERRLDTLAEILECDSMCVAVACINSEFVIAVNEFHPGIRKTEGHYSLIVEIMDYFKSIASTGKIPEDDKKNELLQKIYLRRFAHKDFSKFKATKDINSGEDNEFELIVNSINVQKLAQNFDGKKENFGNNQTICLKASLDHQEMTKIYDDLRKLEQSIAKKKNYPHSAENSITDEQLNAFKNFDANKNLLLQENSKNQQKKLKANQAKRANIKNEEKTKKEDPLYSTHAEMQLLSYLVAIKAHDFISEPIYLGISKKCCPDCACMLNAANTVLAEEKKQLSIKYGQTHEGDFGKNWFFPDRFFQSTQEPLFTKIKQKYSDNIEIFKEGHVQDKYYQSRLYSDSEASEDLVVKASQYYSYLLRKKNDLIEATKFSQEQNISSEVCQKIIDLGLFLDDKKLLDDFFRLSNEADSKELEEGADNFITALSEFSDLSMEDLKLFLKSPYFPKIHQKELLCEYLIAKLEQMPPVYVAGDQQHSAREKSNLEISSVDDESSKSSSISRQDYRPYGSKEDQQYWKEQDHQMPGLLDALEYRDESDCASNSKDETLDLQPPSSDALLLEETVRSSLRQDKRVIDQAISSPTDKKQRTNSFP